jgi:hypothetical protein
MGRWGIQLMIQGDTQSTMNSDALLPTNHAAQGTDEVFS